MRRFALFCLAACLLAIIAACGGPAGDLRGGTPAGYVRPVANAETDETAEMVAISALLESPETYEGEVLEVNGIYYQRQVVVCSTRPQLSPARWALSDGEERIPAGGLDERLENLPSGQIEIAVTGRWLRWQGPVGCGRQAQITEVWYLDLIDIVSPNPITIAAVGSEEEGASTQQGPPSQPPITTGGYPAPGGTAESEEPQVTATQIITGTTPELPNPTGTPITLQTPSPASGAPATPTATPTTSTAATPTTTPTVETTISVSPTATSAAASPSPAATTDSSPIPTATSDGDETVTVDQEELPPDSIETGQLGANEIHRWPFAVTSAGVITVNIASELELDAGIMIRDPSGNIVGQQNNAQDGAPEVLVTVPLTELGTYDVLITNENDVTGYYAILVLTEESYTFVFNGTIDTGQSEPAELKTDNDHFWHFYGTAGDIVTIRVTPNDNSDLFIRLFDPEAHLTVELHNETGPGEVEELLSYTLPDTGFYSILVGELNFGAANYTISLMSG